MQPMVLGLDLGTNSVGWSLITLDAEGSPCGLEASGVRIFEAGTDGTASDFEQGKDSSRATTRRMKRAARRMADRRARRMKKVFCLLQSAGLLPAGPSHAPQDRDRIITELDRKLRAQWLVDCPEAHQHTLPYLLRARAVSAALDAHSLGRALYHLSQRRGYKTNRRADRKNRDDETGVVKQGISELSEKMKAAGCDYLGQYFATLNPREAKIRKRWTSREMYSAEFEKIIQIQAGSHSVLDECFVKQLRKAIFFQRPLKSSAHLIGNCELEPGRKRTRLAYPIAQDFRMLAALNNLEIVSPDGEVTPVSHEQRTKLLEALGQNGDQTFNGIRKLLGLKKGKVPKSKDDPSKKIVEPGYSFNLEAGGETKIPGDRTTARLLPVLGEKWRQLSPEQKRQFICDFMDIEQPSVFEKMMRKRWGLSAIEIDGLREAKLEEGYAAFSREALEKLVGAMRDGTRFQTARTAIYGMPIKRCEPADALPPVLTKLPDLRNPAVCRAMTELRKVVNGIVRKWGKPSLIRIELARDLKRGRKERESRWKKSREREKARDAVKALVEQCGGNPESRADIEKYLLAEECNWVCPYTAKPISPGNLYGNSPAFDVEHIIPFSLSLDNTFSNKTLCDTHYNRHVKMNRLPSEVEDTRGERWAAILERVGRFGSDARDAKLRRFRMSVDEANAHYSDFTERHLADTRYFSKIACEYLGVLYGGEIDESGTRRVQATSGSVTAFLRAEWELNSLLGDGGEKTRKDHRHHAVDATVIALTSPRSIQQLASAAEQRRAAGRRLFAPMHAPWAALRVELRKCLDGMVVSHRVDHRVAGPLHAETNYSAAIVTREKGEAVEIRHLRKAVQKLSSAEVARIADKAVREAVVASLGGRKPDQAFKGIESAAASNVAFPHLCAKNGTIVPIRKVRITVDTKPRAIGKGAKKRYVASGTDTLHHVVLVAEQTSKGERWTCHATDRLEVHRRLSEHRPAVQMDWGDGKRVVLILYKGDCIQMEENGECRLYLVKRASEGPRPTICDIVIRRVTDARTDKEIDEAGERGAFRITSPDTLRQRAARLVVVSPIGEIRAAR